METLAHGNDELRGWTVQPKDGNGVPRSISNEQLCQAVYEAIASGFGTSAVNDTTTPLIITSFGTSLWEEEALESI